MTQFIIGLYEESIVLYRQNYSGITTITTVPETVWSILKSTDKTSLRVYWLGNINLFQSLELTFFKSFFWKRYIPLNWFAVRQKRANNAFLLATEMKPFVAQCFNALIKSGHPIACFNYFMLDFAMHLKQTLGIQEGCHIFWWHEANGEYHLVLHNGELVFSRFLSQVMDPEFQGISHTVGHVSHTLHVHVDGVWQIAGPGEGKIDIKTLFPKASTTSPLTSFLQCSLGEKNPIYCKPLFLTQILHKFLRHTKILGVFLGALLAVLVLSFYAYQKDMLQKAILIQKDIEVLTEKILSIEKELPERRPSLKTMHQIESARETFLTLKEKQKEVALLKDVLFNIWSLHPEKFIWISSDQECQIFFRKTQKISKKRAHRMTLLSEKYGEIHTDHEEGGDVVTIHLLENRDNHDTV